MPQPANEACANCQYWISMIQGQGECRRYPPEPLKFVNLGNRIYSTTASKLTSSDYWCGEWHAGGGPSPAEQKVEEMAQHLAQKKVQLEQAVQSQKK